VFGILAVVGAAASATAQTYDVRSRFAQPQGANPSPITTLNVSATGTFLFTMQGGIFNAQNFPNQNRPHNPPTSGIEGSGQSTGLIQMLGAINGVLSAGSTAAYSYTIQGRVAPFNFASGNGTAGPTGITGIDAPRGSVDIVWPADAPTSPLPTPFGVESYANVHRFSIVVSSLGNGGTLTLNFAGTGRAGNGWGILTRTDPDPVGGEDGLTTFVPNPATPTGLPVASTSLVITFVPAPGSLALLGMGGLVAARRRRA
jgi:hypothetical protein